MNKDDIQGINADKMTERKRKKWNILMDETPDDNSLLKTVSNKIR